MVRNLESGVTLSGDAVAVAVLAFFDRPRDAREAARGVPGHGASEVRGRVRLLRRLGFLIPDAAARRKRSRIAAWKENVASALHHSASRDLRYSAGPGRRERRSRARVSRAVRRFSSATARPRESLFRRRHAPERTWKPRSRRAGPSGSSAAGRFRSPTSRPSCEGTFGRTGSHDGGLFGSLLTKTSPSAGSLHPIECYVLAWNVQGLDPGLYHFDVGAGELRRLRRGRFRAEAVRAASGQTWVGRAAFLCVMTAVFGRSLWKYQDEVTYRTLFLDAGHLAQTFCLLATSRGLGPFTTAAIQDTFIEKLLGLDGSSEFPVYLCGAGVPAQASTRRQPRQPALTR